VMVRSPVTWPNLKACLSDWPGCFELGRPVRPEKFQAVLEEIAELQGCEALMQPKAEDLRAVCEQVQRGSRSALSDVNLRPTGF
jgi:hypothetical protein